jgi:hypothetical protein
LITSLYSLHDWSISDIIGNPLLIMIDNISHEWMVSERDHSWVTGDGMVRTPG